jgi:hypothetical protein
MHSMIITFILINMKYCAIISVIYLEYRLHYGKSLDGHKFHQYQQNEQPLPPQSIEHRKDHGMWCWKFWSMRGTGTKI